VGLPDEAGRSTATRGDHPAMSELQTWGHAERLSAVLQEIVNDDSDSQGVVTGFAAVCEVMDEEGKKLVTFRGPTSEACPVWLAKGMLRAITDDPEAFIGEDDE
jgi:hypothetical protein